MGDLEPAILAIVSKLTAGGDATLANQTIIIADVAAIPTVMVGTDSAALAADWTAALATILGNFTAARIGYLDELDFDLNARLGSPAGASISADIGTVDSVVDAVKAKTDNLPTDPADESLLEAAITTAHTATESNIRGGTESLETIKSAISAVQNNTRFTAAVPVYMNKPDAGNAAFKHSSNLYDSVGNMEDPANNEILLRIVKNDGSSITANLYKENTLTTALDSATDQVNFPTASGWRAMERDAVGKYFFFYKVASDETEETLTVEFGWDEGGTVKFHTRSTEVADVHSDLSAILADVTGIAGAAMRGTNSAALASVCTEARLAELAAANLPADVDAIKTETDKLPGGEYTDTISAGTAAKTLLKEITTSTRMEIKGIWLDLTLLVTAGATIELEHKIDGTNYRVFETDSWALTDDDGVFITGFTINNDFKISITGGEAAGVNIPYNIIYQNME
jgi:hypothetical protein